MGCGEWMGRSYRLRPRCSRMASSRPLRSRDESVPIRSRKRPLEAVVIWSAIALDCRPPAWSNASPGYTCSVRLVRGTTTTLFSTVFAALLLTTTAGRVFWISPPKLGSNEIHQTSPLLIGCIVYQPFAPLFRFRFPLPVQRHLTVSVE